MPVTRASCHHPASMERCPLVLSPADLEAHLPASSNMRSLAETERRAWLKVQEGYPVPAAMQALHPVGPTTSRCCRPNATPPEPALEPVTITSRRC